MPVGEILEVGTNYCLNCRVDAQYQIIDMTGNGDRMDRQWLCPGNHRDTHVQDEYPQYTWDSRRKRLKEDFFKKDT
jgi:hypothetical protein